MPPFLPPDTRRLIPRITARNARRLRRLPAALPASSEWQREALRALDATFSSLSAPERAAFLTEPDLRSWLCLAEQAVALARPRATDRALFELLAHGPHLAEVLPRGRMDARFRRRASALSARLNDAAFARLVRLLVFRTPAGSRFGPFPLDPASDGEESRLEAEIHTWRPVPGSLRLEAGARIELAGCGVRVIGSPARTPVWRPREPIPGSSIVLARRVVASRGGLTTAAHVPGLSRRFRRALALVAEVWPEAHREILVHTRVVIPVTARGTVSYSQPDRPGVSYINVSGRTLIDLADDLLHETAHHRLHALEELKPLVLGDVEPRYHSPWRGCLRPVRGILHAAYTFSYRAQLLARLLRRRGRLPRPWLRRELALERAAIEKSLADLKDAHRRGLLTPDGARLCAALARREAWNHG